MSDERPDKCPDPWHGRGRSTMIPKAQRGGTLKGKSPEERFWALTDRRGDDDCWEWQGSRFQSGYGRFLVDGKTVRVHRWSYEHHTALIPPGLTIDHLCGNRACVNPRHLDCVTSAVNAMRGNGPPAQNARKTHCSKGHEYSPDNTYIDNRGWRVCRACRKERRARA